MVIGERLAALRIQKGMTQGDMQERTGFVRPYISRIEHGRSVPSVESLEKFAKALEIPMHQLFYDGENPPAAPMLWPTPDVDEEDLWGNDGEDARVLAQFQKAFGKMSAKDRTVLLYTAKRMGKKVQKK